MYGNENCDVLVLGSIRPRSNTTGVAGRTGVPLERTHCIRSRTKAALRSNPLILKSPSKPSSGKQRSRHPVANIGIAASEVRSTHPCLAAIRRHTLASEKTSAERPRECHCTRPTWRRRRIQLLALPSCPRAPSAEAKLRSTLRS